jgi:NADH dehydrogenase
MASENKTIVIVGGGAGGLELAVRLGRSLGKSQKANIILIDSALNHIWKPLWHELAAGTLKHDEDQVSYITAAYQHHFQFVCAKLIDIDRAAKMLKLTDSATSSLQMVSYDLLVLAVGSASNDFHTPGARKYGYFLDDIGQIEAFREQFMRAIINCQAVKSSIPKPIRVAIIGGGATGVELAAELHAAVKHLLRYAHQPNRLINQLLDVTVIEGAHRILAMLPERISNTISHQLYRLGIHVVPKQRVSEMTAEGVKTQSGKIYYAEFKIWAAGIKAPDFLKHIAGLESNQLNQLQVTNTLQTTLDPAIFALGDCAACPWPEKDSIVPPKAQAAQQQAKLLSRSIPRYLMGKPPLAFYYHEYGSLVSLSRFNTVGNFMGKRAGNILLEGKIARLLYLSLYKRHQLVLFGWWKVSLFTLANILTQRARSLLKLH